MGNQTPPYPFNLTNYYSDPIKNQGGWNFGASALDQMAIPAPYLNAYQQANQMGVDTSVSAPSFMSNIGDGVHNMMQSQGWKDAFGWTDPKTGISNQGYAAPVLGAIGGIAQSWLGMKQLGLAEEQFDFKKDAWQKEYNNQTTLTNARLRDRQSSRVAANPGAYQSVGDYMNQNRVG